uniref:Uncharacterized protein n=1 Tax=Anopheles merus TaxID=30066 RepID=A0A182VL62_ANOME
MLPAELPRSPPRLAPMSDSPADIQRDFPPPPPPPVVMASMADPLALTALPPPGPPPPPPVGGQGRRRRSEYRFSVIEFTGRARSYRVIGAGTIADADDVVVAAVSTIVGWYVGKAAATATSPTGTWEVLRDQESS